MIEFVQGDIFTYNLDILVNTINCVGVMGKGIALEFKKRFPDYYEIYRKLCQFGTIIKPGHCYGYWGEPYIVSFSTKDHWRDPSKIEWIKSGLEDLRWFLDEGNHTKVMNSIGIPALGCSNGGLNWRDVKPLIIDALKDINKRIVVFEPLEGNYEQSIHEIHKPHERNLKALL